MNILQKIMELVNDGFEVSFSPPVNGDAFIKISKQVNELGTYANQKMLIFDDSDIEEQVISALNRLEEDFGKYFKGGKA